jgi:hypothetical protein
MLANSASSEIAGQTGACVMRKRTFVVVTGSRRRSLQLPMLVPLANSRHAFLPNIHRKSFDALTERHILTHANNVDCLRPTKIENQPQRRDLIAASGRTVSVDQG